MNLIHSLAGNLAIGVLSCLLAPAHAADAQLSVRQEGWQLSVEGWLVTPVKRATAWAVLTDYAHFPEFVPGVQSNQVLEAHDDVKTVAQRGEIMNGPIRMPYDGVMRIEESPRRGLKILFLSGLFKDVQGEWRLGEDTPLKLSYCMRMDLMKSPFPPPVAVPMAEQQVRMWVTVFGREMQRREGAR